MSEEIELPSEEGIAELPRWAIVAFAARCARRVQPVIEITWPDASERYRDAIESAIAHAEDRARGGDAARTGLIRAPGPHSRTAAAAAAEAAGIKEAAAAADAAGSASAAEAHARSVGGRDTAIYAAEAAKQAAVAAAESKAAAMQDFERLLEVAKERRLADGDGVDVDRLGPLWPDGPPKAWPGGARKKAIERDQLLAAQLEADSAAAQIGDLSTRVGGVEVKLKDFDLPAAAKRLSAIDKKIAQQEEQLSGIESLQSSIDALFSKVEELDADEMRASIRGVVEGLEDSRRSAQRDADEIRNTRDVVVAERKLREPLEYWMRRAARHTQQFYWCGGITLLTGVFGFLVIWLFFAGPSLQDQPISDSEGVARVAAASSEKNDRPETDPAENGGSEEAGTGDSAELVVRRSPPVSPEAENPNKHSFEDWLTRAPWRLGQTAFISALLLLLLKMLTRITMSNLHLATEAQERVVMAQTYFDFVEKGLSESEEFRKFLEMAVINAMFRPTTTGLVKDDSAEPNALEQLFKSSGATDKK